MIRNDAEDAPLTPGLPPPVAPPFAPAVTPVAPPVAPPSAPAAPSRLAAGAVLALVLGGLFAAGVAADRYVAGRLHPAPAPAPAPGPGVTPAPAAFDWAAHGAQYRKEADALFAASLLTSAADLRKAAADPAGSDTLQALSNALAAHQARVHDGRAAGWRAHFGPALDAIVPPGSAPPTPDQLRRYADALAAIGSSKGAP